MRRLRTHPFLASGRAALVFASALAFLALWLADTGAARAAESAWVRNEHTSVRLISAASGVGPGRELRLGLQFRMKAGWKIYWRSPGDAGYPPQINWAGSDNVAGAIVDWPAPKRFTVLGLTSMGYQDEVVLPLTVMATQPGQPMRLQAKVNYLTCADVCIPYQVILKLALPAGSTQTTQHALLIDKFANKVPGNGAAAGLRIGRVEVARGRNATNLVVTVTARERFAKPDVFVEGPRRARFGVPDISLSNGGRTAQFIVPVSWRGDEPPKLTGAGLTLTVVDGARSVEGRQTAVAGALPPSGVQGYGLLAILGLALLGGLILNLMPCVLPVLSIKLLSVVSHGGGEKRDVRKRFLATSAGIVASFAALAALLAGLQAAGASVGWGIQFQEPLFLIAILLVLTLFAANLWGLFEIRLPGTVADAAGRTSRSKGLGGDFLTGAFATLLATPCSAPFLGTAVGFALTGGTLDLFAVFAALGVGLALPYLLVAAVPALATRLPKPGPWMVKLKFVLGLALVATAIWLVTVLESQIGPAAWIIGALAAACVLLLWIWRRIGTKATWRRMRPAVPVFVLVLALAAFLVPNLTATTSNAVATTYAAHWKRLDRAAIARHVADGKIVFVDVTADWCLTCKVNKRLVLSRDKVDRMLKSDRVVAMVGDWTSHNEAITRYLSSFGRYGIPFNVVYGPGAPRGIVLPELLSASAVLDAMKKAQRTGPATPAPKTVKN